MKPDAQRNLIRSSRARTFSALVLLSIIAGMVFLHHWAGELVQYKSEGKPPPTIRRFPFSLIRDTSDRLSNDPWTDRARNLTPSDFAASVEAVDQHSTVYTPDEFRDFYIDTAQEYVGIGVTLTLDTGASIVVIRVFDHSPADRAGMKVGDRIIMVGGEDVAGLSLETVVGKIRGTAGSKLEIVISRNGVEAPITLSVTRASVEIPTVDRIEVLPQGILYIRITQFGKNTGREFASALRTLEHRSAQGIMLDLRNNTGGVLHAALDVLDPFFERGERLLSTRGERDQDNRSFQSIQPRYVPDIPVVVLVNGYSASAAEVVAGSLKVTGKATLVGEKTHGKGSIQSVYASEDGGGFKVTTGYCILPDESSFHGLGIDPDIEVSHTREETLTVFRKRADEPLLPFMSNDSAADSGQDSVRDRQIEQAVAFLLTAPTREILPSESGPLPSQDQ